MTYHKTSDLIAEGVAAGVDNAERLAFGAKHLHENGFHAPALSLAVLSLEEIGKIFLINGLVFAKPGDDRSTSFEKGKYKHKTKLDILTVYPLMVVQFMTLRDGFDESGALQQTIAIMLERCQSQRDAIFEYLEEDTFLNLDRWKQNGFYVNYTKQSGFEKPADVISPEFSGAVVEFARTLSDLLRFLLKDNIGKYKRLVSGLRDKLSDEDLEIIRNDANSLVQTVYRWAPEDDEEHVIN